MSFIIDTGAEVNLISAVSLCNLSSTLKRPFTLRPPDLKVVGADGTSFPLEGTILLQFRLAPHAKPIRAKFFVVKGFQLPSDALLGLPALRRHKIDILPDVNCVTFHGAAYPAVVPSRPLLRPHLPSSLSSTSNPDVPCPPATQVD